MKIKNKKIYKKFNKNSHQINFWWENGGNFIICDFTDKRILSIGIPVIFYISIYTIGNIHI